MSGSQSIGTPLLRNPSAKGSTLVYAQILPVMAIVSLFPAIPQLFRQFGSLPHAQFLVPMILTVPSLFVAITASFAGILADRLGRRRIFVWGMTLYAVAGVVPLLTDNLATIVGSRMVLGIAEAFVVTVSSALIGDYFGEQRHKWVALVGIWVTIIGTMLLAAGGALAEFSWRGPFAIYLAVIPGAVMAWWFIDEPVKTLQDGIAVKPAHAPYPWRAAILIGSVTLATSLIYYVEPLNFAAMMTLAGVKSAATIGLVQAVTTIGYITGALAYRRWHTWPVSGHLAIAGFSIGVGLIVIGLSHTVAMIAVGAVIQQFGGGFVIPGLMAWGQQLLPIEQRGRGMGIWVTTFFIGTFLCPPMITGFGALTGSAPTAVATAGVIGIILASFALLGVVRRPKLSHL